MLKCYNSIGDKYYTRRSIMPIPKEILSVPRPKGTVVKYASNFYYVVKRTSVYKEGRRVPKDLGIVGKIIDGKFVEKKNVVLKNDKTIDIKDFGKVAVFEKYASDVLKELEEHFEEKDAKKLYCIAMLRCMTDELTNRDLKHEYDSNYLSVLYPNVGLSESSIPDFLESIGMSYLQIEGFMRARVKQSAGNMAVIDGTLKSYNSSKSAFSDWSRKGRIKGSKDFGLLYSYDLIAKEPIASKPYTGNMLDSTSFIDFIDKFDHQNQLLVLDKGFWTKDTIKTMKSIEGLHYIVPIKSNSKVIQMHQLFNEMQMLDEEKNGLILYRKVCVEDKFYYAFKNMHDAHIQENAYMSSQKSKMSFNEKNYLKKKDSFGLIVFESNLDCEPIDVYYAYSERWNIEKMFNFYKNILDLSTTAVKNDYRIYATEFINFLSLLMSCKVKKVFNETNLSNSYSYKQLMRYLSKVKKCRVFDNRQTWQNSKNLKYIDRILTVLNVNNDTV